ncbi:DNA-processing protein DprA [Effusibacillus dendaii]|uniref:DNA processing protein DprA n=1 Tax=Effusibacillus dendaii TaxID=2743772 RepID=A0A7I8D8A4_9BACL|nr:DNA-processing protein DprA [Effusibacillus dendaii]BCJ85249.1 DNA processing protein DprA [Effusibacillus dendaii]
MPTEKEYVQWLLAVPQIGHVRCQKLLESFESAAAVWEASSEELRQIPSMTAKTADEIQRSKRVYSFQQEADFLKRNGITVIHRTDPDYPQALLSIFDPPHILYVKGKLTAQDHRSIAVVGTRSPTSYGILVTRKICSELSAGGITIVSGLAYGIDTVAHEAAIQSGGRTLAVLAGGLARIYPVQNQPLARQIIQQGALISEFHPLTPVQPNLFPVRNRIISGLSRGVLVTEAARKSGSLITADLALEQGRDVFAVPGPITSPQSFGTNDLIRQGAKITGGSQDIWEEYPEWETNDSKKDLQSVSLTQLERQIVEIIGYGGVSLNQLLNSCRIPSADLYQILLAMELKGVVKRLPGQMYMRDNV